MNIGAAELFDDNNYRKSGRNAYEEFFCPGGVDTFIDDGSISYISITTETINGKEQSVVRMTGNSTTAGKGAAWATFDSSKWEYQDSTAIVHGVNLNSFSFDYNIEYGDSFNAAGLMFNVIENGSTLQGLMVSLNASQSSAQRSIFCKQGNNATVWKFTYKENENDKNLIDIEEICPLNVGTSGKIGVVVENGGYIINNNGIQVGFVTSEELESKGIMFNSNTFGFFSDHYSHNCPGIGKFKLENISITVKFDEGY